MPGRERFRPEAIEAFRCTDLRWDEPTGELRLSYALVGDDDLFFTEVFTFPAGPPLTGASAEAFDRVARLLWVACGTSYHKAADPPVVHVVGGLSVAEAGWASDLYHHGLSEMRVTSGLDPSRHPRIEATTTGPSVPLTGLGLGRRPLVPVGGGKDSCVTAQGLVDAGERPLLASVRRFPVIDAVLERSGADHLHVGRTIDPALGQLNRDGARNGHVPVTAIVSLALSLIHI